MRFRLLITLREFFLLLICVRVFCGSSSFFLASSCCPLVSPVCLTQTTSSGRFYKSTLSIWVVRRYSSSTFDGRRQRRPRRLYPWLLPDDGIQRRAKRGRKEAASQSWSFI